MSIGVVLIGTDGIVLATDSRRVVQDKESSIEYDDEKKLWIIGSNTGLISVSGDASLSTSLREQFF